MNSRYTPTPTIIEAAQALYRKHGVEDISRNDAGVKNLSITTDAISNVIDRCKKNNEKQYVLLQEYLVLEKHLLA